MPHKIKLTLTPPPDGASGRMVFRLDIYSETSSGGCLVSYDTSLGLDHIIAQTRQLLYRMERLRASLGELDNKSAEETKRIIDRMMKGGCDGEQV